MVAIGDGWRAERKRSHDGGVRGITDEYGEDSESDRATMC